MRSGDPDQAARRARMVTHDLAGRGVRDPDVLRAMGEVPRERFMPAAQRGFAYDDRALPIEEGQTISQPYVVAVMLEALQLTPTDRMLEVGSGSGYAVAIAARICREVVGVERIPRLADDATARLAEQDITNATIHTGDGTLGWPADAPYDAILVSAGGPAVPPALVEQLDTGGRLVIPVGRSRGSQHLLVVQRTEDGVIETDLGGVAFVPLVGEQGWDR